MRTLLTLIAAASAAMAAESGFKPIFDGKSLAGWTLVKGHGPGYIARDGLLVCPADGGGNLFTEREYADFALRFEFKVAPGGNNGIGIRAPLEGDAAYAGMEIQILDHGHANYKGKIKPAQHHGSVYDVFAATKDSLKPAGEWNEEEIWIKGSKIKVTLNKVVILEADLATVTDPAVLKKHPGLKNTKGHIGLLGHGTLVEFRNLRVREL